MSTNARQDPRNQIAGPRELAFRSYVAAVTVLGLGAFAVVLVTGNPLGILDLGPAFWVAASLLLVSEIRPLFVPGARDVNGVVLSTAFTFALLLRFDLTVALVLQAVAVVFSDIWRHKALWRTTFNLGQYMLSWLATWAVMELLGHRASMTSPADLTSADLLYALAGALTFFACNELFVAGAIALRSGERLRDVLVGDLTFEVLTTGALLSFGPLVALSMQAGPAYVPLLVPPLAAVYAAAHAGVRSEEQTLTDGLTGLANRKQLTHRVAQGQAALVLLDLDLFKQVNDTLGHHVGDQLLVAVGKRLQSCVRPQDLVARLGGDEFALLLDSGDVAGACRAAVRAREVLSTPFSLEGLLVEVSASAGIAVSPEHGVVLEELLQRADVAMYLSKESGEVEVYDVDRDPNTPGRLVLLGALRRALDGGELVVHYQPKADLASGRVVGVEALVRWNHPQLGLVMPEAFVPLAERSGLVVAMTAWLLDTSLQQLAAWRARGWDLSVSVNITVKDLCNDKLVLRVAECLTAYEIPPGCLTLELTEGSLFTESARARSALKELRALGVSLSLDDFGTGWSSLMQLRQLPVNELKIDRTFVGLMAADQRDEAIVRSVIDLARGLGMRVVAEGVESEDTWTRLAALGCDRAQGFWLSPARSPEVLDRWLEGRLGASVPTRPGG